MQTFRAEKFTLTQSDDLAPSRIPFPTENEPISQSRRPGLKPERALILQKCKFKANSWYVIQKTGVTMDRDTLAPRAPPADSVLALAQSAQKSEETNPKQRQQIT